MATEYDRGFHAGWLAASEALMRSMGRHAAPAPEIAMAGNKPVARRRGRPPKAASIPAPVKRGPGRPRKTP